MNWPNRWIFRKARSSRPSRITTTRLRTSSIPDPKVNVKYGAQSWDEMHVTFVGVVIDAKTNPARTFGAGGGRRQAAPVTE